MCLVVFPFLKNQHNNAIYEVYFTRTWQDAFTLSLHNLLAAIFQHMPLPAILRFHDDRPATLPSSRSSQAPRDPPSTQGGYVAVGQSAPSPLVPSASQGPQSVGGPMPSAPLTSVPIQPGPGLSHQSSLAADVADRPTRDPDADTLASSSSLSMFVALSFVAHAHSTLLATPIYARLMCVCVCV